MATHCRVALAHRSPDRLQRPGTPPVVRRDCGSALVHRQIDGLDRRPHLAAGTSRFHVRGRRSPRRRGRPSGDRRRAAGRRGGRGGRATAARRQTHHAGGTMPLSTRVTTAVGRRRPWGCATTGPARRRAGQGHQRSKPSARSAISPARWSPRRPARPGRPGAGPTGATPGRAPPPWCLPSSARCPRPRAPIGCGGSPRPSARSAGGRALLRRQAGHIGLAGRLPPV